jgi:spore germination protein KC
MRKKLSLSVCMILLVLLLTGCFDATEIGDYSYVSMLGIDEGVTDALRLTFHIPQFSLSGSGTDSGGGGGDEKEKNDNEVITMDAPSLLSGVAILNNSVPKIINFMHMKAIIISEKTAEDGSVGEIVGGLMKYRQIRGITNIIICKGTAQEFIKSMKPYHGGLITETIEELITRSEKTGFIPDFTFRDMYNRIKSATTQFLGIYAAVNKGENLKDEEPGSAGYKIPGDHLAGETPYKGGPEVELFGSAVFDGDKMVGTLTGFETQMVRLVLGNLDRAVFTIQDPLEPKLYIPIEVKEFEKPKINVELSGQKPKISVNISLEGDITSIPSRINYEDIKMNKILEQTFEDFITAGITRTFHKAQKMKVDVFDFGRTAIKQFLTIPEWEDFNWNKKFMDSEITVKVDFTVRRTGKLINSEPIRSTEGEE